ncbi:GNAT family N-acetyltransferase [Kribbella catacumbae]|uniref:GNAT family N-acetyltransferase n=1 Tax=Kribbella catacumbae TaxID=460086 RepID=UPI0003667F82|nr:GNAT family N-acetyltransferase [Kribbella catacumbae]
MIRVRRAEVADAAAVREVGLRTWPVAYDGLASPEFIEEGLAAWWSPEMVERGISNGITLIAVDEAEQGGGDRIYDERVVGMVGVGREDELWVMWKLYILPEYQGQGVGKALLEAAISALPADATQLLLDVLITNEPAIRFYRKHGFVEARDLPQRDLGGELMWMSLDL